MPHRPTWPCSKHTELKTLVHHEFYGTHLGTFVGLPKLLISKSTNFIFSQNIPPSHLPKACHTDQLGHVQYTSNLNILAPRILWYSFGDIWGHSNLHILKTMNFFFSKNTPPSHLPRPWHTDRFGHVQNVPNS